MNFPILPRAASRVAEQTDALYWGLIILSVVICVIVFVPIIYFIFKYREGKPADRRPLKLPQNTIEITWTLIPTLIMMCYYVWGAKQYFVVERPPAGAMEVNVVGKQWMWKIQHPEGMREINALHVPVGRAVQLTMTSQDTIHSFFIPAFRVKQDVLPGRYTREWFIPSKVGEYHLFCAEYCGAQHSGMIGTVYVMEPSAYQSWLSGTGANVPMVLSGEKLFAEKQCNTCHGQRAPTLAGLYNHKVLLNDGSTVTADVNYLRESILQPNAKMVAGYPPIMPTYQGQLSEEQITELIAYMKSLQNATTQPSEH